MHRILTISVVGVLASLALPAASGAASTATPPSVFVRVEGASSTLVPQTLVQTATTTKLRGQTCSGSSAAAALTLATRGQWTGKWFKSLSDFEVLSILGESPPSANDYWTLWINGRSATKGGCGTALHAGDHELWFDCLGNVTTGACSNNPLAVSAPAEVRAGRKVTVTVTQLDGNGHSTPSASAVLNGGGVLTTSGGDGKATFVPRTPGVIRLHAVKSGATPSDTQTICVYARRASQCGKVGKNGPRTRVLGIKEHEVFIGHGPQLLHGTAGPDPAGITEVRLSLFRHVRGGPCTYYDARTGRWHRRGCTTPTPAAAFSVGATTPWSYLLPKALPVGAYHLNVVASDSSGRHTKLVRGRSAIDFVVRP